MTIPHDDVVKIQMQSLLHYYADEGADLHCSDVYVLLGERFPCLTEGERTIPFGNSRSHWANRVQWARQHLVDDGFLERPYLSGRGRWKLTEAGLANIRQLKRRAEELLRELEQLH